MERQQPITAARTFADLFTSIELFAGPGRLHAPAGRKLTVSRYCTITDPFRALTVEATPATLDAIDRTMIKVDRDQIYFKIITLSDRVRVFASYGQIIGSRLLAELPRAELRKLPKEPRQ